MVKSVYCVLFGLAFVSLGSAQSINAFVEVDSIEGVTTSLNLLTLSTAVGASPKFTWNSVSYNITEVWGIWSLDDDDDMSATGSGVSPWNFNSNFASHGGIAGWKAQTPNDGLTAGQSIAFTYANLTGTVEDFGYHVRVAGSLPGGGNTIHIRGEVVPEPASLAFLGLGAAAMLRRRGNRR